MDIKVIFLWLGIILSLFAFWHYFYSTLNGNTKPHSFTWLIFSLLLTPSFFIQLEHGGGLWAYVLLVELIGCIITFILALFYWTKEITTSDKFFLLWWVLTIVMWLIFDQPVISTILIIMIDFFALLPTYRKSWNKPHEETTIMYILSGCIFWSSLLAVQDYNFLTVGHQLAIIIFDWGLVIYLLVRRKILWYNK